MRPKAVDPSNGAVLIQLLNSRIVANPDLTIAVAGSAVIQSRETPVIDRHLRTHASGPVRRLLTAAAEQTTAHDHRGRARGNSVHPKTRLVEFQDEILFPVDVPRTHQHP
jgi:hypothetical protein